MAEDDASYFRFLKDPSELSSSSLSEVDDPDEVEC